MNELAVVKTMIRVRWRDGSVGFCEWDPATRSYQFLREVRAWERASIEMKNGSTISTFPTTEKATGIGSVDFTE